MSAEVLDNLEVKQFLLEASFHKERVSVGIMSDGFDSALCHTGKMTISFSLTPFARSWPCSSI